MNKTNLTFNDLKQLLMANTLSGKGIGTIFHTYVLLPISSLGTLFNMISLSIFLRKEFRNISLYKYMQIYTWASLCVTSSSLFGFCLNLNDFFEYAISLSGRIYRCYVLSSFIGLFFFFANVLEIFLNVERAINFNNNYQTFKRISPYKICAAMFIFCLLVNMPANFAYQIVADDFIFVIFRLCVPTPFGLSSLGKTLLILSYIIQGPLVVIITIVSAIKSLISFRDFKNRKSVLVRKARTLNVDETALKKQEKIDEIEKNLLKMTFYLTVYSVIVHTIQFVAQIILFVAPTGLNLVIPTIFSNLYGTIISFKLSTNIFFYYKYNTKFRSALKTCKKETDSISNSNELRLQAMKRAQRN